MIVVANRVGCLAESRFELPITLEEIATFRRERMQLATRLGEKRVTVIDVSRLRSSPRSVPVAETYGVAVWRHAAG